MVQRDKGRIEERGKERTEQSPEETEDRDVAHSIKPDRPGQEGANRRRPDQRFDAVADVPAKNHSWGNIALKLGEPMSRQRRQQKDPPRPARGQQQRRQQNRIGRPQDRDRVRREFQRKTNFGPKIIAAENQHRGNDQPHGGIFRRSGSSRRAGPQANRASALHCDDWIMAQSSRLRYEISSVWIFTGAAEFNASKLKRWKP